MTVQCCKCKKVRVSDQWMKETVADTKSVSHTYCPDCLSVAREEIKELTKMIGMRPRIVATS